MVHSCLSTHLVSSIPHIHGHINIFITRHSLSTLRYGDARLGLMYHEREFACSVVQERKA